MPNADHGKKDRVTDLPRTLPLEAHVLTPIWPGEQALSSEASARNQLPMNWQGVNYHEPCGDEGYYPE